MATVVECAHVTEPDHALLFLKLSDGVIAALEFGHHHDINRNPHHHDNAAKPAAEHHHSGAKHVPGSDLAAEVESHTAKYTIGHYTVMVFNPYSSHPRDNVGVPHQFTKVLESAAAYTPESLNLKLKEEWYKEHVGAFVFENERSFSAHVMALLVGKPTAAATA
jgi:hypothetical protein